MAGKGYEEYYAIMGAVNPQQMDNDSGTTPYIGLGQHRKAAFILLTGVTDADVNFKVLEATSSGGSGAQDLTNFAITEIAGGTNNKQYLIEVDAGDVTDGFTHVAAQVTTDNGASGSFVCVVALALESRHKPASDSDAATVVQIVG